MISSVITHCIYHAACASASNPRHEQYGSVAVFEDLYGNRWDLLQLHSL